jgi:pantetheine-phosphate adenylyltransferase
MVKAEAEKVAAGHATIEVRAFDSLLVKFAAEVGASVIIRGLRAVSDFEYEFQMVAMNQRLNTEIETVFLMADPRHQAISSRLVKEIAVLGGDISPFTTAPVAQALTQRCKEKN